MIKQNNNILNIIQQDLLTNSFNKQVDNESNLTMELSDPHDDFSFLEMEHLWEDQMEEEEIIDTNDISQHGTNEEEITETQQLDNVEIDEVNSRNRSYTSSVRAIRLPTRYTNLQVQLSRNIKQYCKKQAHVIAMIMQHINYINTPRSKILSSQTLNIEQGIKDFKERGKKAIHDELSQLYKRGVFIPVDVTSLTQQEKARAMESIMVLANGSTHRSCITKDQAASPTATTESVLIKATIDAKQGRDIMIADIPNAFVQTDIPTKNYQERIKMKIRGIIVESIKEMSPETYDRFITLERNQPTLYV